jgi:hypothetical protein
VIELNGAEDSAARTNDGVTTTVTVSYQGTVTVTGTGEEPGPKKTEYAKQRVFQTLAFLELPVALLAIVCGGIDLISAPWLLARILGLLMFLLGVVIIVSLAVNARYFPHLTDGKVLLILAGSVSGIIIAIIFALNTIHYDDGRKLVLYVLCGVPCVLVAWFFFRWHLIKDSVRQVAAAGVVGALVSVTPFIYNSIYLPQTANIAVDATLDSATVSHAGKGFDLVDVKINLTDQSTVRALTLTSMVAVYGVAYSGQGSVLSGTPSQNAAIAVGQYNSEIPNLEFSGRRNVKLITLRRAEADDSFLNPSTPLTTSLPVLIPANRYQELDVELALWYGRADRLTLTREYYAPHVIGIDYCANDVRAAWYISQSTLGRLTHGTETAVTDWCATTSGPKIRAFIGGAPGQISSREVTSLEEQTVQLRHMSRFWIIQPAGSSKI